MNFPEKAYLNKPIFETDWHPSAFTVGKVDVNTGVTIQEPEKRVMGRFIKVGVFNPYKSTPEKYAYDEQVFCQITINDALNRDVAVHLVEKGSLPAKMLKERFPGAWAQFQKECPKAKTGQE